MNCSFYHKYLNSVSSCAWNDVINRIGNGTLLLGYRAIGWPCHVTRRQPITGGRRNSSDNLSLYVRLQPIRHNFRFRLATVNFRSVRGQCQFFRLRPGPPHTRLLQMSNHTLDLALHTQETGMRLRIGLTVSGLFLSFVWKKIFRHITLTRIVVMVNGRNYMEQVAPSAESGKYLC